MYIVSRPQLSIMVIYTNAKQELQMAQTYAQLIQIAVVDI